MKRAKSFLSIVLALLLLLTTGVSAFAAPSNEPSTVTNTNSRELFTSDGELLGTVVITTKTTVENVKNGVEYLLTTIKQYTLESKYAQIPEYQTQFANNSEQNIFLVTKDGRVFVNGKLAKSEATTTSTKNDGTITAMDSGGIPAICHYYDSNDYTNYHFACYSDMSFSVGGYGVPTGSNIQKDTTNSNPKFYGAKASVDSFENDYNDFVFNYNMMLVAAGLTAATWETIIGLIAAGGSTAISAMATYKSWNDSVDDLHNSYGYIVAL